ncbi:MAG: sensor histidine kinase [Bacteroidota bacterium]
MRPKIRLKIRTKLTILFSALFGIVTLIMYFYIPSKMEVFTLFSIIDKARSINEMTGVALGQSVLTRDRETMSRILNGTQLNRDIIYVLVTDNTGTILASNSQTGSESDAAMFITTPSEISPDGFTLRTFNRISFQGKTVGNLYTGFSLQDFRQEIHTIRFTILATSFVIYLVGLFIISGIAVTITKPIRNIEHLANEFREKNLLEGFPELPEESNRKNEHTFHEMIDAVDFVQNTLGTINTQLERRIEVRTKQLVGEIETRRKVENQLHKLSIRLQSVREEERQWIAREIHDEFGQALTGLKMYITGVLFALKTTADPSLAERLTDKLQSMSTLVDTTIGSIQKIVAELRPPILDKVGLVAGIEWYIHQFIERTDIHCEFNSRLEDKDIPAEYATPLFRVLQETMTNVARHAKASEIKINMGISFDYIVLEVQDNGKGITETEIQSMDSLGLLGMRERVAPFHGEVYVSGAAGKGTLVVVRVPMVKTEHPQVEEKDIPL